MKTPALLTTMSSRPVSFSAAETSSATADRDVTSQGAARARPPAAVTSDAVSFSSVAVREARTTFAPARANVSATARPMPRPAPVMMAVSPARGRPGATGSVMFGALKFDAPRDYPIRK